MDSVYEKYTRDLSLIQELDLSLIACLEAHCHAGHVTAAWLFKHSLGCEIQASAYSGIEGWFITLAAGRLPFKLSSLVFLTIANGRKKCSILAPG